MEFSTGTANPVSPSLMRSRTPGAASLMITGSPQLIASIQKKNLRWRKRTIIRCDSPITFVTLIVFWKGKHDLLPASLPLSPKDIDAPNTVATLLRNAVFDDVQNLEGRIACIYVCCPTGEKFSDFQAAWTRIRLLATWSRVLKVPRLWIFLRKAG